MRPGRYGLDLGGSNCSNCRRVAMVAGADEADADNIARSIEARPWPTYEERMAVFSPAGPWKPSREPSTPHATQKFGRADI
jgi:hypothetical protein